MLVVSVIAHDGNPNMEPLRAEFDETGGSIGRGDTNKLILPDPERRISRVHAVILHRNGQYVIQDRGSATPIRLNGQSIGQGNELTISPGDKLVIGGYTLSISSQDDDAVTQINLSEKSKISKENPLNLFQDNPLSDDPFADLIPSSNSLSSQKTNENRGDFFDLQQSQSSTFEKLPEDFVLGPISSGSNGPSIRKIFDLNEGDNPSNLLGLEDDPNNLFDPLSPINEISRGKSHASASIPDDVLEINGSFKMPTALPVEDHLKEKEQQEVLSWDQKNDGTEEIKTMIIKGRARADDLILDNAKVNQDISEIPPGKGSDSSDKLSFANKEIPNQSPKQKTDVSAESSDAALLRAFLKGAGVPDLQIGDGLTVERMETLGAIFRTMVQGTLDLLLARSTIKQEVRAEMTVIVARENNPLKFSPNAEAALAHLLSQSQKGFMEPLAAIEDAYDDLRSHQFGFMAGMRAALKDVLLRFNPERLERRLEERNVIDTLLPMSRKARLWNLFENLYGDILHEAEEDFHALFGKEFVRAYEEQIKRLERDSQ